MESKRFAKAPYVSDFHCKAKHLQYISSKHLSSVEYPEPLKAPILKTIAKVFETMQPGAVIVEGFSPWQGEVPESAVAYFEQCAQKRFVGCGESAFAAHLALQSGMSVFSGEPEQSSVLAALLNAGFTELDLLGFYVIRQVPQWKRQRVLEQSDIDVQIDAFISRWSSHVQASRVYTAQDFWTWYKQAGGESETSSDLKKTLLDTMPNDTAPHGGVDASLVQKISHEVGRIRDRHIVQIIAETLNAYDAVAVIYGASHFLIQYDALTTMLCEPSHRKLF